MRQRMAMATKPFRFSDVVEKMRKMLTLKD